jgi:hypothetical protein
MRLSSYRNIGEPNGLCLPLPMKKNALPTTAFAVTGIPQRHPFQRNPGFL